jgi:hypothetical protein
LRIRSRMRRWTAAVTLGALLGLAINAPSRPMTTAPTRSAVDVGAASGGWLPVHLNACAFGFGLMSGGIAGMGFNPMGGATAFAVGVGIALLSC